MLEITKFNFEGATYEVYQKDLLESKNGLLVLDIYPPVLLEITLWDTDGVPLDFEELPIDGSVDITDIEVVANHYEALICSLVMD